MALSDDIKAAFAAKWVEVRAERDQLLRDSDWVVLKAFEAGTPVPPEWAAYRKYMRDVTLVLNPFMVQWPAAPAATAAQTVLPVPATDPTAPPDVPGNLKVTDVAAFVQAHGRGNGKGP
jgi:hypothetical protein